MVNINPKETTQGYKKGIKKGDLLKIYELTPEIYVKFRDYSSYISMKFPTYEEAKKEEKYFKEMIFITERGESSRRYSRTEVIVELIEAKDKEHIFKERRGWHALWFNKIDLYKPADQILNKIEEQMKKSRGETPQKEQEKETKEEPKEEPNTKIKILETRVGGRPK